MAGTLSWIVSAAARLSGCSWRRALSGRPWAGGRKTWWVLRARDKWMQKAPWSLCRPCRWRKWLWGSSVAYSETWHVSLEIQCSCCGLCSWSALITARVRHSLSPLRAAGLVYTVIYCTCFPCRTPLSLGGKLDMLLQNSLQPRGPPPRMTAPGLPVLWWHQFWGVFPAASGRIPSRAELWLPMVVTPSISFLGCCKCTVAWKAYL